MTQEPASSVSRQARPPVNILLVDDTPANLRAYEAVLAELGENVIKVTSADEAFRILLATDVALVLTDVTMPTMDGIDFARLLREHPRFEATPIVFVSAIAQSDVDRLRGYASGAVDYMLAPVPPELMRAKVKAYVDLYRRQRELEILKGALETRVAERTGELEAALERQSVLIRELEHRSKNLLAVMQSIVTNTLANSRDLTSAKNALIGRLHALARALDFVTSSPGDGIRLRDVIRAELSAFEARVTIEGIPVVVGGAFAQQFALVIHELATNASKYGSLSLPTGRVLISWQIEQRDEPVMMFSWLERDGPPVRAPTEEGFGSKMIAAISNSTAHFAYEDVGLRFAFEVPISEIMGPIRAKEEQ
jgi:two-component sensor histidine kinase